MKRFNSTLFKGKTTALLFAMLALLSTGQLGAQTAVSNLTEAFGNSVYVVGGNESRALAFSFTTGTTTAASFDFTGVTLNFHTPNNVGSGLTVGLYSSFSSSTVNGTGATPLATLTLVGSTQPTVTGSYSFSGSASLLPSTTYYLKLTATSNPGSYDVDVASTFNQTGLPGWTIGDMGYIYQGAPTWASLGSAVQFSVQASAIPEPSTYAAIAGAAMLGLAFWRRRSRKNSLSVEPSAAAA